MAPHIVSPQGSQQERCPPQNFFTALFVVGRVVVFAAQASPVSKPDAIRAATRINFCIRTSLDQRDWRSRRCRRGFPPPQLSAQPSVGEVLELGKLASSITSAGFSLADYAARANCRRPLMSFALSLLWSSRSLIGTIYIGIYGRACCGLRHAALPDRPRGSPCRAGVR